MNTTNQSANTIVDTNHANHLIGQSKQESKRLLKLAKKNNGLISINQLSQAQDIIAQLKGKPTWFALNAAYPAIQEKNQLANIKILDIKYNSDKEEDVVNLEDEAIEIRKIDLDFKQRELDGFLAKGYVHAHSQTYNTLKNEKLLVVTGLSPYECNLLQRDRALNLPAVEVLDMDLLSVDEKYFTLMLDYLPNISPHPLESIHDIGVKLRTNPNLESYLTGKLGYKNEGDFNGSGRELGAVAIFAASLMGVDHRKLLMYACYYSSCSNNIMMQDLKVEALKVIEECRKNEQWEKMEFLSSNHAYQSTLLLRLVEERINNDLDPYIHYFTRITYAGRAIEYSMNKELEVGYSALPIVEHYHQELMHYRKLKEPYISYSLDALRADYHNRNIYPNKNSMKLPDDFLLKNKDKSTINNGENSIDKNPKKPDYLKKIDYPKTIMDQLKPLFGLGSKKTVPEGIEIGRDKNGIPVVMEFNKMDLPTLICGIDYKNMEMKLIQNAIEKNECFTYVGVESRDKFHELKSLLKENSKPILLLDFSEESEIHYSYNPIKYLSAPQMLGWLGAPSGFEIKDMFNFLPLTKLFVQMRDSYAEKPCYSALCELLGNLDKISQLASDKNSPYNQAAVEALLTLDNAHLSEKLNKILLRFDEFMRKYWQIFSLRDDDKGNLLDSEISEILGLNSQNILVNLPKNKNDCEILSKLLMVDYVSNVTSRFEIDLNTANEDVFKLNKLPRNHLFLNNIFQYLPSTFSIAIAQSRAVSVTITLIEREIMKAKEKSEKLYYSVLANIYHHVYFDDYKTGYREFILETLHGRQLKEDPKPLTERLFSREFSGLYCTPEDAQLFK